jgi:uncharacterized protein YdaU (DUF1376 family)
MVRKSPGFTWYPDAWFGGTRRMTRIEKSVYFDLLNDQWVSGGFSLGSAKQLCSDVDPDIVESVLLDKFDLADDGLYYNLRLEEEREKQHKRREKQAENGKLGGRPKTQTKPKQNPNHNPNESQTETQTKAKKKPSVSDSVLIRERERESETIVFASEVKVPGQLDTPEFRKVWANWLGWNLSKTGIRLDGYTAELQLQKLNRVGVVKAIADLEHSMERQNKPSGIWDSSRDRPPPASNGSSGSKRKIAHFD